MIELRANDWFTIAGKGRVASVNLREIADCPERINTAAEIPLRIGQRVLIDGNAFEIRGIEYVRALISPPFIKPDVCLVVKSL